VAPNVIRRAVRLLVVAALWAPLWLVAFVWGAWCTAAIWFSNLPTSALRAVASAVFVAGSLAWLARGRFRPRALRIVLAACLLVTIGWLLIPASNDRDWMPEYSRTATATFAGDLVTIHDLRDFEYRGEFDFTPRFSERTVSLSQLESLDLVLSNWGLEQISHTIVSFGFADGTHVAVSIETRRENGEPQTTLRSLFKQYELIYVVADERDLIRLRADFRKETVRIYPLRTTPDEVRVLFRDVMGRVNRLARDPDYYNLLTQNCTTSLMPHRAKVRPWRYRDVRVLLNARFDELLFEHGAIDTELPLDEARRRFTVKPGPVDPGSSVDYSQRIRPRP
jgi:hypothetical protein